jgi:uncharacterized protein with ATP-grasp and redox domains
MITQDEEKLLRVLRATIEYVQNLSLEKGSPAELSSPVYFMLHEITGETDPYQEIKRQQNEIALSLYEKMKDMVRASTEPLHAAAKLAVIGNAIDCGVGFRVDIVPEIEKGLGQDFTVDDFKQFEAHLKDGGTILYICDNAGEIVFDRIFIEEILAEQPESKVFVAVKPKPILNDATIEDAKAVGLDEIVEVMTTGSEYIGAPMDRISEEMRRLLQDADIVISKGQGNFETLDASSSKTFFLLKAKCELIARELGVPIDAIVFKRGNKE